LLVVADEDEPLGERRRRERPRFGELAGLVDDGDVELLFAHDPRATGGRRRRDDRRLPQLGRPLVGVARPVQPEPREVRADAALGAHADDVFEALVDQRLDGVVDRPVRERRQQDAVTPFDQRADETCQRVGLARARRPVDERAVLGADGQLDRLVLGGVVVDEGPLDGLELGCAPLEEDVLGLGGLGEHRVVDRRQ
jgi:hypothetical protein